MPLHYEIKDSASHPGHGAILEYGWNPAHPDWPRLLCVIPGEGLAALTGTLTAYRRDGALARCAADVAACDVLLAGREQAEGGEPG